MKSADREHYGLAVYCARRFTGRGVPMEELIGEAEAALLFAMSRFDENRGVRFSTYAIPVVLGALRDLCRRAGPMHIPRSEWRILAQADEMRSRFLHQQCREPTLAELAQLTEVNAQRLGDMLASRDRMLTADGMADASQAADGCCFEDAFFSRDLIRTLPHPFAQVLWLRFALGLSQREVALRFGVGQPQVSRWEKEGRERLREALAQ